MPTAGTRRPAWAEVDLGAVAHNARALAAIAAPARLCAVVKADAYGHTAVPVARAALEGGASELAVALVDEGLELREAGVEAPILVLSEPAPDAMEAALAHDLVPTLYTPAGVAAARTAARRLASFGAATVPFAVEVKVDTGMHRVGAAPEELCGVLGPLLEAPELRYGGLWTHFAVADEVGDGFTAEQLERFEAVRAHLAAQSMPPPSRLHAANSAGAIAWPASRYDLVRCGIGLYGYSPGPEVGPALAAELARVGSAPLRPVMSLKAQVTMVRRYPAGERCSYGRVSPLETDSVVATVPLGYADGVDRGYFAAGGEVLIGGRRCKLAGTVTMDQIVVSCGPDADVAPGDEVVLMGRQGDEEVTAEEWARCLGTIPYEVITRLGLRVPRLHLR